MSSADTRADVANDPWLLTQLLVWQGCWVYQIIVHFLFLWQWPVTPSKPPPAIPSQHSKRGLRMLILQQTQTIVGFNICCGLAPGSHCARPRPSPPPPSRPISPIYYAPTICRNVITTNPSPDPDHYCDPNHNCTRTPNCNRKPT